MELLSAGLSPRVGPPGAEPGAIPFENDKLPEIVEAPPVFLPVTAINIVRHSAERNSSVPFENLIVEPSLPMIVQPAGKVCPEDAMRAISAGTLICGFNLYIGTESDASVLQMVTSTKTVSVLRTTPELCVKIFIKIF